MNCECILLRKKSILVNKNFLLWCQFLIFCYLTRILISTWNPSQSEPRFENSNWWPVNSPHKEPVTWKKFPFEDLIMPILTIVFAVLLPSIVLSSRFLTFAYIYKFTIQSVQRSRGVIKFHMQKHKYMKLMYKTQTSQEIACYVNISLTPHTL